MATLQNQSARTDVHYRLVALRTALPHAYAIQNGTIYVGAGAIARMDDEAQFALVVATLMSRVDLDRLVQVSVAEHSSWRLVLAVITGGGIPMPSGMSSEQLSKSRRRAMEVLARAGFAMAALEPL